MAICLSNIVSLFIVNFNCYSCYLPLIALCVHAVRIMPSECVIISNQKCFSWGPLLSCDIFNLQLHYWYTDISERGLSCIIWTKFILFAKIPNDPRSSWTYFLYFVCNIQYLLYILCCNSINIVYLNLPKLFRLERTI